MKCKYHSIHKAFKVDNNTWDLKYWINNHQDSKYILPWFHHNECWWGKLRIILKYYSNANQLSKQYMFYWLKGKASKAGKHIFEAADQQLVLVGMIGILE